MQQNSATLIYDLNTMKGTTESYLKKIALSFQTVQFQAWKIALSSKSLKKNRKLFWATLISESILLFHDPHLNSMTFQVFHVRIPFEPYLPSLFKVWSGGGFSMDDHVIYNNYKLTRKFKPRLTFY